MEKYFLGIDIGGTKIECALINSFGKIINKARTLIDDTAKTLKGRPLFFEQLLVVIKATIKNHKIHAIGIGVPGKIDNKTSTVIMSPNLKVIEKMELVKFLKKIFKVKVTIDNDANCFMLSEIKFGAAKNYNNVAGFTLGTGIGGGFGINKTMISGARKSAGEFGHMIIEKGGRSCACGKNGCLEAYASGSAIEKRYMELYNKKHPKYKLKEIPCEAVFEAFHKKEHLAIEVVNEAFKYLAIGIANIIEIMDPDVIVLGGGISNNKFIFPILKKEVKNFVFGKNIVLPEIIKAELGESSGVLGAAALNI